MPRFPSAQGRLNHEPDSTLAVTKTCPKDGVHLYRHGNIYWGETRSALDIRRGQHIMKYVDITRAPHSNCEWWGFEADREGRGLVGYGIDRESHPNTDP